MPLQSTEKMGAWLRISLFRATYVGGLWGVGYGLRLGFRGQKLDASTKQGTRPRKDPVVMPIHEPFGNEREAGAIKDRNWQPQHTNWTGAMRTDTWCSVSGRLRLMKEAIASFL